MQRTLSLMALLLFIACGEKLMQEPEHLIAKEKMIEVLSDMAIVNAAKSTNVALLRDNNLDPTAYVFKKNGIDSVQFVESDRYYASLPAEYEAIYIEVEKRLTQKKEELEKAKNLNDSLQRMEIEAKRIKKDSVANKGIAIDSLP
ncbi:MAG: DUF4296 domain-containing protein [Flavobacteriaceae bacterium]